MINSFMQLYENVRRDDRPINKVITHSIPILYLTNFKLHTSLRFLIQISTRDVILYLINLGKPIIISKLIKELYLKSISFIKRSFYGTLRKIRF